ncbi:MAG: glycosyltransferase family 9 protein [Nanoarchaeota archaeon]|nr:glycosyltransferase family 9 protein [Nanoarchaeota archaeon]
MKVLIIKLGASGDVIRTLPIAQAVRKKYPDSEITWITKEHNMQIFEANPHVQRVFSIFNYPREFFDILYNFDVDEEATRIAKEINAEKKFGFYNENGYPVAFNLSAEYYLNTLFDDNLKKTNKRTYQEMMFDAAELPYSKELPVIVLTDKEKDYAEKFLRDNNLTQKKLIGIYAGSSPKWPSKVWNFENTKEFIRKINKEVLLLGGPDEKGKYEELIEELKEQGIKIYTHDLNCSLRELISLISLCDEIVCPDSVSLHISLALKKPTIGLFFCTSPDEIEGYGTLKKIVSPKLYDFFPEKQDLYSEELTKSISAEEVLNALSQ